MSRKNKNHGLSYFLFVVYHAQIHRLKQKFSDGNFEINMRQWQVLHILQQKDGLTQQEISQQLLKDKSVVARQIDTMVSDGLVQRQQSRNDQRCNRIYLTEKSKPKIPVLTQILQKHEEKMRAGLSQEEISAFEKTMEKILKNITETENNGHFTD
ncbi:MarR family transcriptional regulator [bacterium]|nr:MarR family transcriptional regulator [bacterium]